LRGFGAKVEYALLAALDLAAHHDGDKPSSVSAIAARTAAPRKYLVQILLELKRAALVGSTRGPRGGYWLMRRPALISLAEIVEALEPGRSERKPRAASDAGREAIKGLEQMLQKNRRQCLSGITLDDFLRQVQQGA